MTYTDRQRAPTRSSSPGARSKRHRRTRSSPASPAVGLPRLHSRRCGPRRAGPTVRMTHGCCRTNSTAASSTTWISTRWRRYDVVGKTNNRVGIGTTSPASRCNQLRRRQHASSLSRRCDLPTQPHSHQAQLRGIGASVRPASGEQRERLTIRALSVSAPFACWRLYNTPNNLFVISQQNEPVQVWRELH